MQESFWWWQCSDRYIISLFLHLHTPSPISLMVSVDIKHHVYLPTYITVMHHLCWKIQNVFCKFALLFLFLWLYSWFTLPIAIFQKICGIKSCDSILHFFMVNWWSASLTDLGVIVTDLKNCFASYLIVIIDLYSSFSLSLSPWYNHNGWLDIKHQVTYSPSLFSALSDNILPFSWRCSSYKLLFNDIIFLYDF